MGARGGLRRGRAAGLIFTPFAGRGRRGAGRVIYAHALHLIVMGIEQCHRGRGGEARALLFTLLNRLSLPLLSL